jgi:hypothetical protein
MKCKIFLLLVAISLMSCNKKPEVKVKAAVSNKDTLSQEVFDEEFESELEVVTLKELKFPTTGKKAEDFVPESCEIKNAGRRFFK